MSYNGIRWRPENIPREIHLHYCNFVQFHNEVVDTINIYDEWETPLVTRFIAKGGFKIPRDTMWPITIEQLDSLSRWFWPMQNGWTMCCLFTVNKDLNDLVSYTNGNSYIGKCTMDVRLYFVKTEFVEFFFK